MLLSDQKEDGSANLSLEMVLSCVCLDSIIMCALSIIYPLCGKKGKTPYSSKISHPDISPNILVFP